MIGRVAILGGGMAGLATAWRLSEPGWQEEIEAITVYQRGWRLGGKGASSRGVHGRIEEHGLHLWLGYYENAFRLLRECYEELDRPATDPQAPIRTWREALLPAGSVGLEDRRPDGWHHWLGQFSTNDQVPGEPEPPAFSLPELLRRALRLILDFLASLPDGEVTLSGSRARPLLTGVRMTVLTAIVEASALLDRAASVAALDRALAAVTGALREPDPDVRRTWHLVAVMTTVVRGLLADGVTTDRRGFRALNDEDFLDWIIRHGAPPEVADFAFIRGLYDLVFAERGRRGVSAGVAVFLTTKMFFEYRGAIFWKLAAGMGDVVFAPLYEALRRRGVQFEFFHRVDALHLSEDRLRIERITVGRQAHVVGERYEPLLRFGGLPCFPSRPRLEQLDADPAIADQPLESHACTWPDAETRVLRRGEDFDVVVFAASLGIVPHTCAELLADRREWRAMVEHVTTTATQAVQLWLREDEPALGWGEPGVTVSAYEQPLHTWASMPQLIDVECWPEGERPGAIAYFCGALEAGEDVHANAVAFFEGSLGHLLPGVVGQDGRFRWELVCPDGLLCLANDDPSDRYVQCAPGSDAHRLRADESGYDNLFLAGDWTDNGLNAGCIEAAVLSGLRAANAVLGRSRAHRIAGVWLS